MFHINHLHQVFIVFVEVNRLIISFKFLFDQPGKNSSLTLVLPDFKLIWMIWKFEFSLEVFLGI
ncbi:hypothetical protein ASU35_17975 [Acetivibrio ethanolgignens]|uniref:Uncharacterized protein n=1 Tax=Acetivibrio ethanolgignens TaxID=290052 RepID=A0A0V8QGQ9_9FIRM|nr:hypothetical protein ASU35_17975 [Acetivibrio ethanolgignens]